MILFLIFEPFVFEYVHGRESFCDSKIEYMSTVEIAIGADTLCDLMKSFYNNTHKK